MKYWRIYLLLIIIFLVGGGVLARLFSLQILQYDYYSVLAQDQHQLHKTLFPERGEIFLQDLSLSRRNGDEVHYPLAINKEFQQVYLIPNKIIEQEKDEMVNKLSDLLDLNKEVILQRINKQDDPYEPLKHKVNQEIVDNIKELSFNGLGSASEIWRYYPNKILASHITGFLGITDEKRIGQYGLEGYYEDELKGKIGFLTGEKDTTGYGIPSFNQRLEPAQDGSELILTIDQNIQFKVEKELIQIIKEREAESGSIIIMEPSTGAILAMANWPIFDPNEYNKEEDISVFLNSSIQKVYEPGSVFKPITMAIGIDSGKITPQTVYQDTGQVKIKGSVIKNVDGKAYGQQTMIEVLEKSLNTGAVFVQQEIGQDIFQEYIQRFNFNKPTKIDLIGEVAGDISNLFTGREINLATISFGQGITVTPIGLITALGSIANKGKMMRPFLVKKIIHSDGTEVITKPEIIGEPISSETAKELTKIMVSVTENGFGKSARVNGYNIAGKTGTAQIPDSEKGGYSEEDTIHTFIGFAPAFNPQFIILIKIDKPQGIRFASDSVGPVFKRLAEYLFNYLEIPPQ